MSLEDHASLSPAAPPAAPRSCSALFWAFSGLALQGFGGVLAVAQRELVERRRWLSNEAFLEEWAVAQVMPGPNVVNLSLMIGARYFGLAGALSALAGMLTFPLIIVLALAALYAGVGHVSAVQGALRGMGAVAAGLMLATALKMVVPLRSNVLGRAVCAGLALFSFIAVAWLRWPLAAVLLGLGACATVAAYQQLGRRAATAPMEAP